MRVKKYLHRHNLLQQFFSQGSQNTVCGWKTITGKAINVDDTGNLLICTADGITHSVTAGEVSIQEV